ncbi:hypothetical protein AgCh_023865 [Apium graveolens]
MEGKQGKDGTISLSYPMLSKSNYTVWSLKMKVIMQAQGIWDTIEPKDPKVPTKEKVDKLAMAAIYQAIPEDILLAVVEKTTVKSTWDAIRVMCQGAERVKKDKVQTLKSEFESLKMKETETIDEFSMTLNGLITNIRTLGETIKENYVVKKLLRAVPTKFLQITSAMEQFGQLEEMTIEEAVGSLKAHEERIRGQTENNGGQLLLTEEEWAKREASEGQLLLTKEEWLKKSNKGGADTFSGQKNRGNFSRTRGIRDKSRVKCFNCHGYGHFAADYRKP